MNKTWIKLAAQLGLIVLGNLMYALAVVMFIVPNGLITGGTTGLALFFYRTAGIPISLFVSVFNISMFLIGTWILGKTFALTTVVSTVIYPLLLEILGRLPIPKMILEERVVAVIYAGCLIGAGIGVVMRAGGSTGGMDIPALIFKKLKNINVSVTIYLCDCVILALQMATDADSHAILYGLLLIAVYTIVLDKVYRGKEPENVLS